MNAGHSGCEVCGRPLSAAPRGRPARYCSPACRARAYRLRAPRTARGGPGPTTGPINGPTTGPTTGPTGTALPAGLSLERIVRAAVAVADRDGVEALSMRRTADELKAGVMSLYRHVRAKEELIDLVVDAVFREHQLPEPGPTGWRARLELSARAEWAVYRARPWMVPLVAATARPPIALHLMAYTDWRMRAVDGQDLDFATMVQIAVAVSACVQGAALALAHEDGDAREEPGSRTRWLASRQDAIRSAFDSGRLPMVSQFGAEAFRVSRPESVFEFGLQLTLDGIALLLGETVTHEGR